MKRSQGRAIIFAIKRRSMTYGEMLALGISTSPWKRVKEALGQGEKLVKGKRGDLVTWRVVPS